MKRIFFAALSILALVLATSAWMVATEAASALRKLGSAPAQLVASINALPAAILPAVIAPVNAAVGTANASVQQTAEIADRRIGDVLVRFDAALGTVNGLVDTADSRLAALQSQADGIRGDLQPVLQNVATLTANYAALPDRIAAEVRPSWLSIQPEITCRTMQGDGYGGCTHARINALLGEATRVGGVFTQHFPSLVSSINGTAENINSITYGIDHRWIHPPPRTKKQKVWGFIQDFAPVGARVYGGAK